MIRRAAALALILAACHAPREASLAPLPRAATAHYLAARLASAQADWATAAEELGAAAAAAPEQPMIAVARARAQARAGDEAGARATLAATRAAWPEHAEVWLASGEVLTASDPAAARAAFDRAIALAPTDERAYLALAQIADPAAAERALRTLVARVPTSALGHYRLAVAIAPRDLPGAIAELRAVLERDPDQLDARLDLARALRQHGELDAAIAQTRSAFDRAGQALDVAEELFGLLCEADDVPAAVDLLTLLDDDREDVDALLVLARLQRGLGRLDAAAALGARITALDADAGAVSAAELALAAGDPVAAAERALTVAAGSPRFAAARRVAAEALLAAGDPAHARAVLEPARGAAPADLGLALQAAYADVDLGRAADGPAELAQVAPTRGAEIALARARIADRAGDARGALAILEPLLAAQPGLPDAANLAGYLLVERGERLADAERYLRRARDAAPGDPAILDSWGWLELHRGHARAAVRALGQAARLAPREPEILLHLAAAWAADHAPVTAGLVLDAAERLHPTAAVQHKLAAARAALPAVLR